MELLDLIRELNGYGLTVSDEGQIRERLDELGIPDDAFVEDSTEGRIP